MFIKYRFGLCEADHSLWSECLVSSLQFTNSFSERQLHLAVGAFQLVVGKSQRKHAGRVAIKQDAIYHESSINRTRPTINGLL